MGTYFTHFPHLLTRADRGTNPVGIPALDTRNPVRAPTTIASQHQGSATGDGLVGFALICTVWRPGLPGPMLVLMDTGCLAQYLAGVGRRLKTHACTMTILLLRCGSIYKRNRYPDSSRGQSMPHRRGFEERPLKLRRFPWVWAWVTDWAPINGNEATFSRARVRHVKT